MKYIIGDSSLTLFFNGRAHTFERGSNKFNQIAQALTLPESKQEEAVAKVINATQEITKALAAEGLSMKDGGVYCDGKRLPDVLERKIRFLMENGLPTALFVPFWREVRKNPAENVVESCNGLYDFLAHNQLPLTEDGCFYAYRGIQNDWYSKHGNTKTRVLKGKVDKNGRIYNGIGEEIEVARQDVDANRDNCCAQGLHVGSLAYAQSWGPRVVLVKVNPKDVVSVPHNYSGSKCRVCAYKVLKEISEAVTDEFVTNQGEAVKAPALTELDKIQSKVMGYINRHKGERVTVRKLQNSFSPDYPSAEGIKNALKTLGYKWNESDGYVYT